MDIHANRILILDFGSQYTQLIARRIREIGVYCEIRPYNITAGEILEWSPKGIVLSGGPESTHASESPRPDSALFEMNIPLLGICYGMQVMATMLNGSVSAADRHEFGYACVELLTAETLWKDLSDHPACEGNQGFLDVWMSHGDQVTQVPANFQVTAQSENCGIAAMAHKSKPWYGVQFHPEVTHTHQGKALLENFVVKVCHCELLWTTQGIIASTLMQVRDQVGKAKVLLGLSGGVDSSVVAALLHQAIGEQLVCVFVDNGLLRLNEGDQVMAMFAKQRGIQVIRVNAQAEFYAALKGISEPEEKRRIIGHEFIRVFRREALKLDGIAFLAQGTIYPDVIESAQSKTGKAHLIKSHHNVGGLPEDLPFTLVEPLRELFKDEVRRLGLELGLPADMIHRHPFPGPGLGVRILGEVHQESAEVLRKADDIFLHELHVQGWYERVSQAFAVFLPVKSVGVVGDARRYAWVIGLRAVETIDFMTARWAHLPYELLERVSNRIINEIPEVSRVVYDVSSKPPATIEWE